MTQTFDFSTKKIIQISQKLFWNNICVLIITNIKICTLEHVILKLSKSLCQKIKKFQSAMLMKESTMQAYLKKNSNFFLLRECTSDTCSIQEFYFDSAWPKKCFVVEEYLLPL